MSSPHIIVVPLPIAGHVNPLVQFSAKLVKNGMRVSFIVADYYYNRVMSAIAAEIQGEEDCHVGLQSQVKLHSIPDGLGPEDDKNDMPKLFLSTSASWPAMLEKIIQEINGSDREGKVTAMIADLHMGWALEVADKMGIKGSIFWPSSAAFLAVEFSIPNLIDQKVIDNDGVPIGRQTFQLSPSMIRMDTEHLPWNLNNDLVTRKKVFDFFFNIGRALKLTNWWLCNTSSELEPAALTLLPNLVPIGPLMTPYKKASRQHLSEEGLSCLNWLDQQPARSVIYVAFGSLTFVEYKQFQELALGLELTRKPYLWVVPSSVITSTKFSNIYPDGFNNSLRKIVGWAPQQMVLSHPTIACFVTHCGWNSIVEGLCNGVPLLCWPFVAEQFYAKTYVSDVWKIGLAFESCENGIVSGGEIKNKLEQLVSNEDMRERCSKLGEMTMKSIQGDGQSSNNISKFIQWLKE
uniref:Glycosyltransferase n=1 Tax=Polygala tenuifolia TaxID=355332 RepID=A0A3G3NBD4_9FABA|nr:UDP-glucosyltransferase UGT83N1 [Polygala tenuifolia]